MTAWKIVPKEAAEAMQVAMQEAVVDGITINDDTKRTMRHAYRAMLAASPAFEPTEAMVEKAARRLMNYDWNSTRVWETSVPSLQEVYLGMARAVLSQLNEILEG